VIMGSLAVCIMYWAEKGRVEEVVEEQSAAV
jgi:DHA1 family bicyclomycin/chloramphenicol resistance-like MFS transporter